jgi:hypothetical protein
MHSLILIAQMASETVVKEEESALPLAIGLAFTAFALFSILLIAVTRLNPDR